MYLSFDHGTFTNKSLDKKTTALSSRIFFTKQLYNYTKRSFFGMIDFKSSYGSTAYDLSSMVHEFVFDTHFLYVLSGKIVNKIFWEDEVERLGVHCVYTNSNLEGRTNVQYVERLENEGATEETIRPFYISTPCKYHCCVVNFIDWMM